MKYKEQALRKVDRLDNKLKSLKTAMVNSPTFGEINNHMEQIKEEIQSLREIISIENDDFASNIATR